MKKYVFSVGMVLLIGAATCVAQTVATNPVGFISITVSPGSVTSPVSTLVSPTLTNPIAFQGVVASVSGTAINITGATFTTNQFNGSNGEYYVEVFSATQAGVLADITATGTSSVTTAQDLSSLISAGESIAIRQHITLNQFLGANNTYGLLGSSDPSTADAVLIYDNGTTHASYWYYDGSLGGSAGWYDLGFNPAGSITIAPFEGVVIQRKGSTPVTIVSVGAVKTGNTLFPVNTGVNFLGTLSAQGLTLGTSGLYNGTSGLTASSDPSTADQVLVYTSTASSASHAVYWYYDGSLGGPRGWYSLGFNSASSIALSPGSAFVVNRNYGPAFNWTLPAPSSF